MRVLTVYASAHGSTAEVAHFIADVWRKRGLDTAVTPVAQVRSLEGYDAYAFGSAVHNGLWLPEMANFARRSRRELSGKPVYLWLTCLRVTEPDGYAYVTNNYLPNILLGTPPFRRIGIFAGMVDMAAIDQDETWTLAFRYDGAKTPATLGGDFRDWKLIRTWAEEIATDLAALS